MSLKRAPSISGARHWENVVFSNAPFRFASAAHQGGILMIVMEYKTENSPGFGKYWSVFTPRDRGEDALPEALRRELGRLYPELELDLASDDLLGEEERRDILRSVEEKGYCVKEISLKMGGTPWGSCDDVELEI